MELDPLPREAYAGSLLRTARALLGARLVREQDGRRTVGRIVELEAYGGPIDPAAHSFRRRTERNAAMFGPVGHAYVYRIYGVHWCLNLVAGERELAAAILLRGVEVEEGLEEARRRRAAGCRAARMSRRLREGAADGLLASGPGRLAAAFDTDQRLDGHDLCRGEELWLSPGPAPRRARWSPRIGLGRSVASRDWCWRVVDADSGVLPAHPGPWHPRATPGLSAARAEGHGAPPRRSRAGGSRA